MVCNSGVILAAVTNTSLSSLFKSIFSFYLYVVKCTEVRTKYIWVTEHSFVGIIFWVYLSPHNMLN